MISLSPSFQVTPRGLFDGYVRITFEALSQVAFTKKHAWEDGRLQEDFVHDDIPACRAGYCEWTAEYTVQQISIGWAWFGSQDGRIFLAPGGLSSNVMLVTLGDFDLGVHKTGELLHAWLSGQPWQGRMNSRDL
ncbi:MAG: DUF4902 domain-containing protein [Pseudoxanthomonas sp.]